MDERRFFGHPRGLATLFFTEAWERFSYYGMKAILLYYLYERVEDGGLGIAQGTAKALIAVYGAAVYLAAIAGGWVSDRLLGTHRCTLYGGVLIMCGHLCLAVPAGSTALYLSMVLIVLGTGLLKPNVSVAVGGLYDKQDVRRDAGFSIYYMGISVGAVLAPLTVGTLGQEYDFHLGFGLAAVGMALGLVVYVRGRRRLGEDGWTPNNPLRRQDFRHGALVVSVAIALVGVVAVLAVTGALTAAGVVNTISVASLALPIGYFAVMFRSRRTTAVERTRLLAYVPLFLAAVCFWIVQEQGASVLAQFADEDTDPHVFGMAFPSSWFQSVGSLVLIVCTPLFAALWTKLGTRQPSTPRKIAIGLVAAGASFLLMTIPAAGGGQASPWWLFGSFALVTLGEICLSPVGQSATTRLAPAAFATQTMGLWLAADAAAQGITAQIVGFYRPGSGAAYFGVIGGLVVLAGVALLAASPAIRRRTAGADVGV